MQFEGEFSRAEHAFLSTDPAMEQNARSILCAIEKWIVRTRADGGLVLVVHGSSDNCSAQNKCGFFMVGLNILANLPSRSNPARCRENFCQSPDTVGKWPHS